MASKTAAQVEDGDRIRPQGFDGRALKTAVTVEDVLETGGRVIIMGRYRGSKNVYPFTYRPNVVLRLEVVKEEEVSNG